MALLELREAHVAPERGVEVHLEPRATLLQPLHVLVDDAGRKPEGRNPPDHHPPEAVRHLVDVHRVAGDAQVVRGHQPRRARAHDADALAPRDRRRRRAVRRPELVHHEALQVPNLHRPVAVDPPARGLARRVAHPPADGAERIGGGNRLERALVVLVPDVGDVRRRVGADGTGDLARRGHVVHVAGVVLVLRRRVRHQDAVDVVDRHQPKLTRSSDVLALNPGSSRGAPGTAMRIRVRIGRMDSRSPPSRGQAPRKDGKNAVDVIPARAGIHGFSDQCSSQTRTPNTDAAMRLMS